MSQEQPAPGGGRYPGWQSLLLVGGGVVAGAGVALAWAFGGWVAFGIAGAHPNPVWGTLLWVVSAAALGGGIAGPPGWAHRPRIVVGVVLAVAWFVYLWLVWRG